MTIPRNCANDCIAAAERLRQTIALAYLDLLTKQFKNGVLANESVDLHVSEGEIFGLLGPNGAGKTTLVRQLTGELLPTAGELRIMGIDVVKDALQAKWLMGVVPQEADIFYGLKAEEHLAIFGRLHGLTGKETKSRTEELIAELHLEEHRSKLAGLLSGGLKRAPLGDGRDGEASGAGAR
jgi:ABC-2 type transport system ATP-binding protein